MDGLTLVIHMVKERLSNAEGGHDWWHTHRVWTNAKQIAKMEKGDLLVIELASLLHDIADSKFHDGDERVGPQVALKIMKEAKIQSDVMDHVIKIIEHISFKNSFEERKWTSRELEIVQDADRLDAIGAIGIARAFNFGGFKNSRIFDPNVSPEVYGSKEQYKSANPPTINHFYEKLLYLKDKMNTETGRMLAKERHDFMVLFLEQFYSEIDITPSWHKYE